MHAYMCTYIDVNTEASTQTDTAAHLRQYYRHANVLRYNVLKAGDAPEVPRFLVPHDLRGDAWSRCSASFDGIARGPLEIYFDHFSSGAQTQRGWVDCRLQEHGVCNRQRQVFGSKRHYCAFIVAWEQNQGPTSKEDHMSQGPTPEAVAQVEASLVLRDF